MTVAGAAGCILGGTIVFTPWVKKENTLLLAGALGMSAGVMLMVSLGEIFSHAVTEFELEHSKGASTLFTVLLFFAGFALVSGLDVTLHSLEHAGSFSQWRINIMAAAGVWARYLARRTSPGDRRSISSRGTEIEIGGSGSYAGVDEEAGGGYSTSATAADTAGTVGVGGASHTVRGASTSTSCADSASVLSTDSEGDYGGGGRADLEGSPASLTPLGEDSSDELAATAAAVSSTATSSGGAAPAPVTAPSMSAKSALLLASRGLLVSSPKPMQSTLRQAPQVGSGVVEYGEGRRATRVGIRSSTSSSSSSEQLIGGQRNPLNAAASAASGSEGSAGAFLPSGHARTTTGSTALATPVIPAKEAELNTLGKVAGIAIIAHSVPEGVTTFLAAWSGTSAGIIIAVA